MPFSLELDSTLTIRAFDEFGRHADFALIAALSKTAGIAKVDTIGVMKTAFTHGDAGPTPYTLNSLYTRPATKSDPTAEIGFKQGFGGTPAKKFLGPQIFSGPRRTKRYERKLQALGVLPQGVFTVPGKAARIDPYGNMARGQIVQLLADLGGSDAGATQAQIAAMMGMPGTNLTEAFETKRKRRRKNAPKNAAEFVVAHPQGRPPGIYLRLGSKVKGARNVAFRPVLIFSRQPMYSMRFPYYETVINSVRKNFLGEYVSELTRALATARYKPGDLYVPPELREHVMGAGA